MVLLPLSPAGFLPGYLDINSTAVFVINFVAVFYVAMVNSKTMDLMMDQSGTLKGGLIHMTFEYVCFAYLINRRKQDESLLSKDVVLYNSSSHPFPAGALNRHTQGSLTGR